MVTVIWRVHKQHVTTSNKSCDPHMPSLPFFAESLSSDCGPPGAQQHKHSNHRPGYTNEPPKPKTPWARDIPRAYASSDDIEDPSRSSPMTRRASGPMLSCPSGVLARGVSFPESLEARDAEAGSEAKSPSDPDPEGEADKRGRDTKFLPLGLLTFVTTGGRTAGGERMERAGADMEHFSGAWGGGSVERRRSTGGGAVTASASADSGKAWGPGGGSKCCDTAWASVWSAGGGGGVGGGGGCGVGGEGVGVEGGGRVRPN